jgi:regulator of sigma E protease
MELLRTLIATIACLGTLIVFHELGHYLVARWCGVKVLRFSVGMGKVVWSRRIGPDQTEWAISALPLGGYVKMLDAREQDLKGVPEAQLAGEFTRQSVWKRIAIVAAGPLANFLLAIVLYAALFMYGVQEPSSRIGEPAPHTPAAMAGLLRDDVVTAINGNAVSGWSEMRWQLIQAAIAKSDARLQVQRPGRGQQEFVLPGTALAKVDLEGDITSSLGLGFKLPLPTIGEVQPGGAGARAGLQPGDIIETVDGQAVADRVVFINEILRSPGRTLAITGQRKGQPFALQLTPEAVADSGSKGLVTVGKIKVSLVGEPDMIAISYGPLEAVGKGSAKVWETSTMTLKMIGKMMKGEVSLKNVTGPVTIAEYAGKSARMGLEYFLGFVAFISVSLGLMNLLPIPVLDGGHLLYYSLEVLTGRPVSERFGEMAQRLGVGLLVALMTLALFNDAMRHM